MTAFALDLDHGGIRLLRRNGQGWEVVDEVALDASGLASRLAAMRARAERLAEGEFETELVIPETQILYTRLPLPETGAATDAAAVAAGLDGLTPCPADELVFDWRVLADGIAVAALDINTLDEAESFAVKYGFNPVRFSARPRREQFPDFPDFGATQFVREAEERAPVIFASRRRPEIEDDAEDVANVFADEDADAAKTDPVANEIRAEPSPEEPASGVATDAEQDAPDAAADPPPDETVSGSPAALTAAAAAAEAVASKGRETQRTEPEPMVSAPAGLEESVPEPALAEASRPAQAMDKTAAKMDRAAPDHPAPPEGVRTDDAVEAGELAATPARAVWAETTRASRPVGEAVVDRPTAAIPKAPPLASSPPPRAPARPPQPVSAPRPQDWRRTAITLTVGAGVLASLVAFALFLVAPEELPEAPPAPTTASEAPDLGMPSEAASPLPIAAPPLRRLPDRITPDFARSAMTVSTDRMAQRGRIARDAPAPDFTGGDTAADGMLRSTDIWQLPPPPPPDPVGETLDTLYLASIDPVVTAGDAFALAETAEADGTPTRPAPVPEQGRTFDLDAMGRVIATAEGAETPDGVIVRLARPPAVPPTRPAAAVVAPDPAVALALAGKTPRARPARLIERNERARFGGRTRAELASLAPLSRPESAQESTLADASLVPSDLAVANSPLPPARPADLAAQAVANSVARAREDVAEVSDEFDDEPDATTAAMAAPTRSGPSIPTSASVARQATIPNAMNLRRVNLIGVYGSARDRRALVRLPSGRYLKVQVGDRVDGGRVAAIGEHELRYVKGGRNVTLKVPSG